MLFVPAFILLAAALFCSHGAALIATTEDGKKVLLNEDGSWKFAAPADIAAIRSMRANADQAGGGESRVMMRPKAQDEPERAGFLDVVKGDGSLDIRKASWGMDKAEVKKTETLQLFREAPATLEYKFKLIGLESRIIYKFTPDKTGKPRLSGAQYLIDQDDVNPARFFEDYASLKDYLQQLYGPPVADENDWSNDIYKKNWGFAISLGFLSCRATWKNSRTKIVLRLSGGNHLLRTNIEYAALR